MSPLLNSDSGFNLESRHTHTHTHAHTHTHTQAKFIHIIEQMASDARLSSGELKLVHILF